MTHIDADTRKALAGALRLTPSLSTCHMFSWPGLKVTPGTYDRVNGRWVLRADGGSVAIQHRALSSGRLATDHEGMARGARVARTQRRENA